ncbi:unnamed protein product [Lasius platythorax]|uniref:Reverse transcriptase domain-containing protein n=1 Tax=Lasius platythorax TaxID=488582 RepID=A0AAV2N0H5_9HYME
MRSRILSGINSIPWRSIKEALRKKRVPEYLRRIIDSYLSKRCIVCRTIDGRMARRSVEARVPLGTVFGPLFWNFAYDSTFKVNREMGCRIICYADDTLIIATAEDAPTAAILAGIRVTRILSRIERLKLRVSEEKTEAVLFHGRTRPVFFPFVSVGNCRIKLANSMKYLGIYIDNRWIFRDHFAYVEAKVSKVTLALCRLVPKLKGPMEGKRQLYSKVIQSVLSYGASIWCDVFDASKEAQRSLRRVQRTLAIRVIAAYRTMSCDAALLLAGIPVLHITAMCRKGVYERSTAFKIRGEWSKEAVAEIEKSEHIALCHRWEDYLQDRSLFGQRTIEAVRPKFSEWITRTHGSRNYYMFQLFTGHGSFGHFLFGIRKKERMNLAPSTATIRILLNTRCKRAPLGPRRAPS